MILSGLGLDYIGFIFCILRVKGNYWRVLSGVGKEEEGLDGLVLWNIVCFGCVEEWVKGGKVVGIVI